jgi:hypothetical protein
MAGLRRMPARMLARRGVAAPDVPALGAPPQVQPPPLTAEALGAAGSRGRRRGNDRVSIAHCSSFPPGAAGAKCAQ